MRNLADLGINEGGRPVLRPAPAPEDLKSLERRLGAALPSAYIELLRYSNGGHPQLDSFLSRKIESVGRWAVNCFYFLTAESDAQGSVWKALKDWRGILGDRALPIANDGGGNQIFLSFSKGQPSVKLCIHDQNFKVLDVADSFEEFVDMLESDPDMV